MVYHCLLCLLIFMLVPFWLQGNCLLLLWRYRTREIRQNVWATEELRVSTRPCLWLLCLWLLFMVCGVLSKNQSIQSVMCPNVWTASLLRPRALSAFSTAQTSDFLSQAAEFCCILFIPFIFSLFLFKVCQELLENLFSSASGVTLQDFPCLLSHVETRECHPTALWVSTNPSLTHWQRVHQTSLLQWVGEQNMQNSKLSTPLINFSTYHAPNMRQTCAKQPSL